MSKDALLKQINQLDLSEKLLMVEDLWDSIANDAASLPMPEWQKAELDKRISAYKKGHNKMFDWQEVHQQLRQET